MLLAPYHTTSYHISNNYLIPFWMWMHERGITYLYLCNINLVERVGNWFEMKFIYPPTPLIVPDATTCRGLLKFIKCTTWPIVNCPNPTSATRNMSRELQIMQQKINSTFGTYKSIKLESSTHPMHIGSFNQRVVKCFHRPCSTLLPFFCLRTNPIYKAH